MQKTIASRRMIVCLFLISLGGWTISGCSREEISPELEAINAGIRSLAYDMEEILNVQDIGGLPSQRDEAGEKETRDLNLGILTTCKEKTYALKSNFGEVAILQPTQGIIWPGALVKGNKSMLDGLPDPITLDRAPMTLRIDLPGIGEQGNIKVSNPTNSIVQARIDEALEWWNAHAFQEGYYNAANSSYQASTSYSSTQLSMDVGLNVAWATGDVASQFNHTSTSEKRVAMMVYKQVFYTISMDPPRYPGSVFSEDLPVEEVQATISAEAPPAYVHSVSYGRIIMVRMETTAQASDTEITGAFNYASGFNSADGSLEAKYKEILRQSSMTAVTIGGNAKVASQAVTARGFGDLQTIITGDNAVYSRSNPGVPIAYTIRYLKDNSFAKMGYSTEYTVKDCGSTEFEHQKISYTNRDKGKSQIRIKYQKGGFFYNTAWRGDIEENQTLDIVPPDGAYGVEFEVQHRNWGWFQGWDVIYRKTLNYVDRKTCYDGRWSESDDQVIVRKITCP